MTLTLFFIFTSLTYKIYYILYAKYAICCGAKRIQYISAETFLDTKEEMNTHFWANRSLLETKVRKPYGLRRQNIFYVLDSAHLRFLLLKMLVLSLNLQSIGTGWHVLRLFSISLLGYYWDEVSSFCLSAIQNYFSSQSLKWIKFLSYW